MATPGEKLAQSLVKLKELQDDGIVAIKSSLLSRTHQQRLVDQGFIREVLKGWYISNPQLQNPGDTTFWYMSYWDFCAQYLQDRYGDDYCISADQSLLIHTGNHSIPHQLIIKSSSGNNQLTELLFGTSLFTLRTTRSDNGHVEKWNGLNVLSLPSSLVYCSPAIYKSNSSDVQIALNMIKDSSEILEILLKNGHSVVAGRLVGAFRTLGNPKIAEEIQKTMKFAGYDIREVDPFKVSSSLKLNLREKSPYINRVQLMWHTMRETIIDVFPSPPDEPVDVHNYLKLIEEIYTTDAYHSLSIEKFSVNRTLIERVRSGEWDALSNKGDIDYLNAIAARGYWQAFSEVKESIKRILNGENAGKVVNDDHGNWYRALYGSSVTAGLLKPADLAGYRNNQVYIGQSRHTPVNKEVVRDLMPVLFDLLENESHPGVRAVLGHFIFVYIHPYMDGNGRMGRFLMNAMLASGGYPWTVIPVEERSRYMNSLEKASVEQDIKPFATFIAWLVEAEMKGYPIAPKM